MRVQKYIYICMDNTFVRKEAVDLSLIPDIPYCP